MSSPESALESLPLLRLLPTEVRQLVEACFEPTTYPFGTVIVREGDEADAFYVLVTGTARVIKAGEHGEEVPLATLGPGASFGEGALLEATTRIATVRASSEVTALRLDRSIFQALGRNNPQVKTHLALQAREYHLRNFLRVHSGFARLPADALTLMLRELVPVIAAPGEVVVRQGDPEGPMYIVESGRLRAYDSDGESRHDVGFLRPGDFFGELSMLRSTVRAVNVEAVDECHLLRLDQSTFHTLISTYDAFRVEIEQQATRYDYRRHARVPLDFADEILPADVAGAETVSPEQAETTEPTQPHQAEGSLEPAEENRSARIRRFPHVWQIDEMDCGAACVAIVCRYYGRRVGLPRIRQVVHTSTDGTSLMGIAVGAREVGLAARTIKASKSRLDELPLPAIVHWDGNHWVVLFDTTDTHVRVSDPATGIRRIRRAEFEKKWSGYAALLTRTDALDEVPEAESHVRWMSQFFLPYRATFVRALILAVVAACVEMLIPVFSAVIVDKVVARRDFSLLNLLVLAMLGVLIVATAASVAQRYLLSRATVRIDGATLDFLTGKLLDLPLSYFSTRRTGDIVRRLAGTRQVRQFLVQNGVQALTAAIQIAVAVALMFAYSWRLALVYVAAAPLYLAFMRFSTKRLRPMFDSVEESYAKYESRQIDAIKGIETVKAMGAEKALRQVMLGQFNQLSQRLFRSDLTVMLYEGAIQLVTFLSLGVFLWVGALQVLHHQLSVGDLVSFTALVLLANGPIATVLVMWDQLQYSSILVNRMNDILEPEPEQGEDHSQLVAVRTLEGRISVRGAGFHYGGPVSAPILAGIDLEVEPGTTVAVVGRSGSGKSTLIKCLAGLLELTDGTILYDGVELSRLDYRSLRRQIGFVLQDNHLFDDTIAANIAFGEEHPDMEQVIWAARVAAAHEFIERLPLGYETKVGDTGLALSGGQRQRVAIARAVYPRPPILILDEATSSLDSESEHAVQENIDQLLEGRTSFVIAHRLSTVRNADVIVVLDRGHLVERGTHDELMAREGLYYYLVSQQLGV